MTKCTLLFLTLLGLASPLVYAHPGHDHSSLYSQTVHVGFYLGVVAFLCVIREKLLALVNEFAEACWKTKGVDTYTATL
ncbi:MAG: hypothetical protein JKY93_00065 [Gammaproteobacteria bacterium]|nr:hypothetical protein [Gammaproteobacteria bacterium]